MTENSNSAFNQAPESMDSEQEANAGFTHEFSTSRTGIENVSCEIEKGGSFSDDIGMWPECVTENHREHWVKKGSLVPQNCDDKLLKANSFVQYDKTCVRRCQASYFAKQNRNGEITKRSWLCFSPSNGRLYCFVCKLFSPAHTQFTHEGFCDWKHAVPRLADHEVSKDHLNAVISFSRRSKAQGCIDSELHKQAEEVANYWRSVLKRVVSVVKFLSERGLAFRGENEIIGSQNNGNFLGLVELIAEYDDFLKSHLTNTANRGRGHCNYLSSTICEEIIELMGKMVLKEIVSRIMNSKYYSVSMDSTPDEGHVDQLVIVFRYVENDKPVERFLTLLPNQGHKGKEMFDGLMKFLNENGLKLEDCRGQSYDNASAMSGKYNGLQALIRKENCQTVWIPCSAHSLNLVGKNAAECCTDAVSFFNFLEELYSFFTASTKRFTVLSECLKSGEQDKSTRLLVPKRVADTTRWSCRADASKALVRGYKEIKNALQTLAEDKSEAVKTRVDASGLLNKMTKLETAILAVIWNNLLERIDGTNHMLQDPSLDLNAAVAGIKSLRSYLEAQRDFFSEFEKQGAFLSGVQEYTKHRQQKINVRLLPLNSKQAPEAQLTPSDKFRTQSFYPIIDSLVVSLEQRLEAYKSISSRFGFLNNLGYLSSEDVLKAATNLVKCYPEDLDESFARELLHFQSFCKELPKEEKDKTVSHERWMYKLLMQKNIKDSFPNVEIALRIFLVLMVTNCSGERSFSKLKLVKNRLRTSMNNARLNSLILMSLESDILRELPFDDLISDFASEKARRVPGFINDAGS